MNEILGAAALTHTEAAFLESVLVKGRNLLGSFGASAFIYDAATEALRLAATSYFDVETRSLDSPRLPLGPDSFSKGRCTRLDAEQLSALNPIDAPWENGARAFALAFPVYAYELLAGVFLFDFECQAGGAEPVALQEATESLCSAELANALQRVRASQARVEIVRAVEACSGIREQISKFLAGIQDALVEAKRGVPDLLYLQLVDWRREIVRTVRGRGLPLSFQNISHPLGSMDIQAQIVEQQALFVIAGKDPMFDSRIFDKFDHAKYVRLFLPLFPFPFRAIGGPREKSILDALKFEVETNEKDENLPPTEWFKRKTGRWGDCVTPPKRLVYGTLELGYSTGSHREGRDLKNESAPTPLTLAPFTDDFVAWCVAKAYALSQPLYEATLDGAFDRIGRTIASVSQAEQTRLWADLAPSRTDSWSYPIKAADGAHSVWPVAIPRETPRPPSARGEVAGVEYTQDRLGKTDAVDPTDVQRLKQLRDLTRDSVREVIRVALRIDNQLVDPFVLRAEVDDEGGSVGTEWPDATVKRLVERAARDSGADAAALWHFEEAGAPSIDVRRQLESSYVRVSPPVVWAKQSGSEAALSGLDEAALQEVATSNQPEYPVGESIAMLPLELRRGSTAVLVLHFTPADESEHDPRPPGDHSVAVDEPYDFTHDARQRLEAPIEHWVQHLALRRMANMTRFTELLHDLRQRVAEARKDALLPAADQLSTHVERFAFALLDGSVRRLHAAGAMLTIYSRSKTATGEESVERFWVWPRPSEEHHRYLRGQAISGDGRTKPCERAMAERSVLCFQMQDRGTIPIVTCLAALDKIDVYGEAAQSLDGIKRLIAGRPWNSPDDESNTMLVIPALAHAQTSGGMSATVTVFPRKVHYYESVHRQLILELGELIGEGLGLMREQDQKDFDAHHRRHLETRRQAFANAQSMDALVGSLLRRMGSSPTSSSMGQQNPFWGLANDAALWLFSPKSANNPAELVLRSWRGWEDEEDDDEQSNSAGRPFADHPVRKATDHPLLHSLGAALDSDRPQLPGLNVTSFYPAVDSANPILREYARHVDEELLLSLPLLDADRQLYGILDLFRTKAFEPGEDVVVQEILHQLAIYFCQEFENLLLRQGASIATTLHQQAARLLHDFKPRKVYQSIVDVVGRQLRAAHCDLYFDRAGKMFLEATTRDRDLSEAQRKHRYHGSSEDDLFRQALRGHRPVLHRATPHPARKNELSSDLAKLLAQDPKHDRLTIPLLTEAEQRLGALVVTGPIEPEADRARQRKTVKKSGRLGEEHLRLSRDLGVAVSRVLLAALPVDRQGMIVTQTMHSLSQPLTTLWGKIDDLLDNLQEQGLPSADIEAHEQEIERHFDKVNYTRANMALSLGGQGQLASGDSFCNLNVVALVSQEIDRFKSYPGGVTLYHSVDASGTWDAWVHERGLRMALANLLDNAFKYSFERTEVRVHVGGVRENELVIKICNLGVGIPQEDQARIFDPFFRSPVPDRRARLGNGLGLSQVKEAIEHIHGGSIEIASTPKGQSRVGPSASDIKDILHETVATVRLSKKELTSRYERFAEKGGRV